MAEGGDAAQRWAREAIRLDDWMRARDYAGWDPLDFLASPLIDALSLHGRVPRMLWVQLGKRLPVQLRGVLGVPKARNAKAVGLVLASHARLAALSDARDWKRSAAQLVDWLSTMALRPASGIAWGYYFPWQNRSFHAPANTPASVVTAFVGDGLLDAAERLGDESALDLAGRAAEFLLRLNRIEGADGTFCFSYTPVDARAVHNANLLTASLLARVSVKMAEPRMADAALPAARFSARAQRRDGSWPYGVARNDDWVDSFHTSYNLVALRQIGRALETDEFEDAVARGAEYWLREFVTPEGVRLYAGRAHPVDMHATAHALVTLHALSDVVPDAASRAAALAEWSVREMRHADGHFFHQKGRLFRNRLAYMRWVQAWMLRGLTAVAELSADHAAVAARTRAITGE